MKTTINTQYVQVFFLLLVTSNICAEEAKRDIKDYTLYPFGATFHFKVSSETNDGNLNFLAISKTTKKNNWNFENGIGTFVDTYHTRSYIAFSDISHDNYKYGFITPMLSANCAYKGYKHSTKKRRIQCFPLLKFRLGNNKGFVLKIAPMPKVKKITNGQISFELGYTF